MLVTSSPGLTKCDLNNNVTHPFNPISTFGTELVDWPTQISNLDDFNNDGQLPSPFTLQQQLFPELPDTHSDLLDGISVRLTDRLGLIVPQIKLEELVIQQSSSRISPILKKNTSLLRIN